MANEEWRKVVLKQRGPKKITHEIAEEIANLYEMRMDGTLRRIGKKSSKFVLPFLNKGKLTYNLFVFNDRYVRTAQSLWCDTWGERAGKADMVWAMKLCRRVEAAEGQRKYNRRVNNLTKNKGIKCPWETGTFDDANAPYGADPVLGF